MKKAKTQQLAARDGGLYAEQPENLGDYNIRPCARPRGIAVQGAAGR